MPDIRNIIKQMTLEQKAALCAGANSWATVSIEELGIPEMIVSDGPHGVRHVADMTTFSSGTIPATGFPTAAAIAATWDPELAHQVGQAIADECIAQGVDVILGPGVNMKRTPLCGRNFEYYSEDPFLAGEMAANFIQGVQSKGVGTSLKHFATNNQEDHRFSINSEMDERTLREIYLPAFETAVKKAKPWTVMCAYNRLNGTFCSENSHLLKDILKGEWGFEGLVVSDWGAVHDRVASLRGGLDLEMPGPKPERVKAVIRAVKTGQLEESVLDESLYRILKIVFKANETRKSGRMDVAGHHELAYRVACEASVLLKNEGILPLKNLQQIAVIGRAAKSPHFQGGGSSEVNPTKVEIPLDELKKAAGRAIISYFEGYQKDEGIQQDLIDEAVQAAKTSEVALIFIGAALIADNEGNDRPIIDLTPQQVALIKAVSKGQPNTVVVLTNGSAVAMEDWIDDVPGVLYAGTAGQAGASAVADVLFGNVNPSGKLAETFPVRLVDTPAYFNYPGNKDVRYGEGIFIGYRYYDMKELPVMFPFGYGKSYTTFKYSSPSVSADVFRDMDGLTVSVNVTNTGKVAGKETVQFYVHDRKASLVRPPKELKGFAKVELQPGETKTVSVHLDFRSFAFYHPAYDQWITEDGEFDILIGASVKDIHFTKTVALKSTLELPCILNRDSTIREWLADPRGKVVYEPLHKELVAIVAKKASNKENGAQVFEKEMQEIMERRLLTHLNFEESNLPMPADKLYEELLTQVYKPVQK